MHVPGYDLIDELARSGAHTVYRARRLADSRPLLLKIATRVPARAADREGLQRELDNLRRWSLPGVPKPQAVEDHDGVAVLVLENDDVTSLRELLRGGMLDLNACIRVALGACAVLGDIHRHGGIHGTVTPDTVLVTATGDAQLLDLGLSVNRLADLRQAATASGATYISPEQTARINRSIDYRTDFYSLGVTLYELLTGAPPFQSSDSLELVHAHIARAPVPLSQRNPAVPETLSRVVLKLLAKAADDRYQSAQGLKHDLERCQREWRESGTVTPFALGARDVPDRFLVSQKLYGREKEVAHLLTAFDRTCEGSSALVLVAGYSGIGKTSLIQELYRPIVQQRGYFIAGKCDQVVRNIPFSAFAQAMRSLVSQLLTESESRLAEWRTRLSSALGSNGGVLAEVVPEIELILGRQLAVPPLEPTESRNRFGMVFQAFVATLARQEHPLVIFLDDLQWVDAATLDLLQALVTAPDLGHLLIVGAYRDNEVDATHLLSWAVERLIEAGATVDRVSVDSLTARDLTSLVGDTLHTTDAQAGPLAALLQRKTDGNPFFVIQFMQTLNQDGLFTFDHDRGEWRFDIDQIESAEMTDNVVDLMTRKIRRLSRAAERVLTMAACIGNRFDEGMLLTVSRQSPEEAAVGLAEALDTGLIRAVESPATADADADGRAGSFSFLHDRVQQAAYGLIPDAQKKTVHLDMGRLLLAGTDRTDLDERIFTIVNHLNIGADLITDRDERRVAAQLNLSAGRKAKTSTAYRAALDYFEHGMSLLDPPDWSREYDVLYPLHLESAECQHLCGEFASADVSFQTLLQHVVNPLDQAQVHGLRTTLYENQSRWADAIVSGLQGLGLFGISFPQDAAAREAALEQEMATIERELAGRPIAALVALPAMTDASIKMVMRLLMNIWAPAFIFNDHATARLISATMVRLSLTYGNTEESAYGYVTHAITVGPVRREYATAYEWGVLAVNVNKAFSDLTRRAKIEQQFQAHVNPWCRPFATCIAHAREACRSGLETGDFIYVGYAVASEAWAALAANRDLDRFVREYTPALAMLEKVKMADFRAAHEIVLSWTLALQGRTASRTSITHDGFDERAFVGRYERTSPFFLTFLYAAKLHLCLIHEQFGDAVAAFKRARAVAATGTIWPVLIDAWGALATAAAWDTLSASERDSARRELLATQQELRELSDSCPENFKSFWLLVAAEVTRVDGDQATAARLAEDAVAHARDTDNLQLEALALEVGARIWRRAGRDDDATRCLRDAHRAYARWGAAAKTAQLEERYPEVRAALQVTATEADAPRTRSPELPTAEPAAPPSLDMATVFKIAHAVAVEIELDGLLRTLMRLALENAGADRALFLQEQAGGGLVIAAEAVADPPQVRVGPLVAIDDAPGVARSVARYVQRTRHDLVLAHAAHDERFGGDDYVRASGAKSLLCVPVGHQGRLGGILYLENSFATDVFTPDRIEMMRILAAQTAISLENARLYADMKDEVARRTTAEGALREALSEVEALKSRLEAENVYLQEEIRTQHNFNEIVGNSPSLVAALRKVERVAPTESTVLIVGETGSGKEMFARAVHSRSQRSARPLVKVNCGAIAPGLVESELFGHVKGAFTGAIERRIGRFELANGGTIFLDEVGELPLDAQVKLLRVLQEQEFEPVGSSRTVRVSVRVIAATNRDLASAVREGRFRADLLYRLNVFPIEVPPLRDRPTDIPLLIGFFSTGLSRKLGKPIQGFSAHSLERMSGYTWPGNVRELQNVVERAAILAQGPVLQLEDTVLGETRPAATAAGPIAFVASGDSMDDVQRGHILSVLQSTGGVVEGARGAASILGMHPNTLRSRMKKLGIPTSPRPQSGS